MFRVKQLGTEVRFSVPVTQVCLRLFWEKLSSSLLLKALVSTHKRENTDISQN